MRLLTFSLLLLNLAWVTPAAAAAAPDGAKLYARHCAVCHGENGVGGIGVPLSLPSFLATVSNDYLRKTIQLGRPGRVMPPSGFNPAEIEAVVRHMRSWSKAPAPHYPDRPIRGNAEHGRALFAE